MITSIQLREFICKTDPNVIFIDELDEALVGLKNAIESKYIVPTYDMDLALQILMDKHALSEQHAVSLLIRLTSALPEKSRPCFITYFRNPQDFQEESFIEELSEEEFLEDNMLEDFEDQAIQLQKDKIQELMLHIQMQQAIIQEHVLKDDVCNSSTRNN